MTTPSSASAEASFQPFTQAERIQQLNDIDKKLHELLRSAGLAMQTLSESRREEFTFASNTYLQGLQAIDVGLRRQIYGLEEAEIIPAEKKKKIIPAEEINKKKDKKGGIPGAPAAVEVIADGGVGKLDIGWLNSNSGQVDRDVEAELWAKARKFLEAHETGKSTVGEGHGDTDMAEIGTGGTGQGLVN